MQVQSAKRVTPTTSQGVGVAVPHDAVEYGGGHYRREQVSLPDAKALSIIAHVGGALVRFRVRLLQPGGAAKGNAR